MEGCIREQRLRLLTYNTHWSVGTDGTYDPERVGRVVAATSADVAGLQEVHRNTERFEDDQAQKISDATGSEGVTHVCFGAALRGFPQNQASTVGEYGNAMLSRWPCVARKELVFENARGWSQSQEPRGCLACQYDFQGTGTLIWVITTHLGCDIFTGLEQARAAGELVAFADSLGRDRTLICGDFNTLSWQSCHRTMRGAGWVDCWLSSEAGGGRERGYFEGCTSPAPNPLLRIDYIYRHSSCVLNCDFIETVRSGEATVASDHFGLLASFSLRREGGQEAGAHEQGGGGGRKRRREGLRTGWPAHRSTRSMRRIEKTETHPN